MSHSIGINPFLDIGQTLSCYAIALRNRRLVQNQFSQTIRRPWKWFYSWHHCQTDICSEAPHGCIYCATQTENFVQTFYLALLTIHTVLLTIHTVLLTTHTALLTTHKILYSRPTQFYSRPNIVLLLTTHTTIFTIHAVLLQLCCNPLWLTGLKAPTN